MRFRSQTLRFALPLLIASATVLILLIVAGVLFIARNRSVMEAQLKNELKNNASVAALQFDGTSLGRIRPGATMATSPDLRDAVLRLRRIRQSISGIRFAYIMRKTDDPATLAFVADADLALPSPELDRNGNGVVDRDEEPSKPGDPYDWSSSPILGTDAFLHPVTDADITHDQWGAMISGYAPIRSTDGNVVAVLGIDKSAEDFLEDVRSIASPLALLLIFIALLSISLSGIILFLKRRAETLEQIEMERSGLLRLAFHQLGGPLTIISWSLEELEDEGPASLQKIVLNIEQGVRRLTEILEMLRNADLVHEGKLEYKPEFGSLATVLKKASDGLAVKIAQRKQTVTFDLEENISIQMDLRLITGVVREILTNAIDFSPNGATISIRSRRTGGTAEFSIIDTGCGIPKKDMPRIFSEFTRGSNATTFKADGNGLGLYIVKGIVEYAGGTIGIKSVEGKGTTVTVRLPMA